jgi:hypothetical protein
MPQPSVSDAHKMASPVDLIEAAQAAAPAGAASPLLPASDLVFRPEAFFLGRTEGAGVVHDTFGRLVRRCRIATRGALLENRATIQLEEEFTYDDGEIDVWRWLMSPGRNGRYAVAEARAGAGIAGEVRAGDYQLAFRRPMKRATGWLAPRFSTRFTLLSPDLALKRAEMSLYGAPLGRWLAVHRRIEA